MKLLFSKAGISVLLVVLMLISAIDGGAAIRAMKMSEAVARKIVSVDGINTRGHYVGFALKLSAKTLKKEKDTIALLVDVGLIMKPDDSTCQPMVLAGGDTMVLPPGQCVQLQVVIFCGNSPLHCPKNGLHYSYFKVGSDKLVEVLRLINKHKLYNYLGQSAVWVITNRLSIGCVYSKQEDELSKQMIGELCRITGDTYPKYFTINEYSEVEGTVAFIPKTIGLVAEFRPKISGGAILSVEVYDKQGILLERLIDRQLFNSSMPPISVTFDPRPYGSGEYVLKLKGAEGTLEEKVVKAQL